MRALTAVVVAIASIPVQGADAKAVDSIPIRSEKLDQTPTIAIGTPDRGARVSKVTANLTVLQTRVALTLQLELVGAAAEMRDVTVPLSLPAGSRPVGMEVTIGSVTTPAVLLAAAEARAFYDETVRRIRDPGLLEVRGDALALHVFPIVNQGTQRVALSILLPRVPRLAITGGGQLAVDLQADGNGATRHLTGAAAQRFELPAPALGLAEDAALDRTSVDAAHSLVAGGTAAPGAGVPTVLLGPPNRGCYFGQRWVDKSMIRSRIKLMMPKLTYCYERELYRDKTLAGTVDVRFAVEPDGRAHVLATDGTLTDQVVRSCVANVFEQIEFPRGDTKIIVNYPLTYRAVEY